MKKTDRTTRNHVVILAATALLLRLACHLVYTPFWAGDSPGYATTWLILKTRQWQLYDGFRPPGYPAMLGLAQWLTGSKALAHLTYPAAEVAIVLQQLLGLGATVLLYFTLQNVGASRRTAFIGALIYSLLMPVAQFEFYVLPLAPAASLVVLSLWLFTLAVRRASAGRPSRLIAIASGLAFACAALFRVEASIVFACMLGVTLVASFLYRRRAEFRALRPVVLRAAVAGMAPLLIWMSFNGVLIGQFTMTTLRPYNLSCTVYNIFDRVPKKDRVFGRIMAKYYRGPARIDLINDAWAELLQNADKMPLKRRGPWTLAADMTVYSGDVAGRLQRRYPGVYLTNALQSFSKTFYFPHGTGVPRGHISDPESPDGTAVVRSLFGFELLDGLRRPVPFVMGAFYLLTILCLPMGLISVARKRDELTPEALMLYAIALATVGTLLAYSFLSTYFYHYGMVFFGPIVICGVAAGEAVWKLARSNFWRRHPEQASHSP